MKRLLAFLLVMAFFVPSVLAERTEISQIVDSTLLDNSPTSISGTKTVKSADKIGFFVTYDETEVGATVSVNVTASISWDGTTWVDSSFYDFAGGATLQTTEALAADGNYFFWLPYEFPVPFVRVLVTGVNTDADDTALVSVKAITRE